MATQMQLAWSLQQAVNSQVLTSQEAWLLQDRLMQASRDPTPLSADLALLAMRLHLFQVEPDNRLPL